MACLAGVADCDIVAQTARLYATHCVVRTTLRSVLTMRYINLRFTYLLTYLLTYLRKQHMKNE